MEPSTRAVRYSHRQCLPPIFRCALSPPLRTVWALGLRPLPVQVSRRCWLCWPWVACAAADKVSYWTLTKEAHDTTADQAPDRRDPGVDPDLQRAREPLADRVAVACLSTRCGRPQTGSASRLRS